MLPFLTSTKQINLATVMWPYDPACQVGMGSGRLWRQWFPPQLSKPVVPNLFGGGL